MIIAALCFCMFLISCIGGSFYFVFKKRTTKKFEALNQTLDEMKKELAFVRNVLDSIPFPCIIVNKQGEIQRINQHSLTMLEIQGTPKEFVGSSVGAIFYNDPTKETVTDKVLKTEKTFTNVEAVLCTRKGKEIFVLVNTGPVYVDKELYGAFSFASDISQMKLAELKVEEQAATIKRQHTVAEELSAQLASAMQELSSTVGEISATIEKNSEISTNLSSLQKEQSETVSGIQKGIHAHSSKTEELKQHIDKAQNQLSKVFKLADQTNILALNATIEASRKNSGGEGFAVIASEVKELSTSSKETAQDVSKSIEQMLEEVGLLFQEVKGIEEGVNSFAKNSEETAESAEEVEEVTQSIAVAITEMQHAIEELTQLSEKLHNTFTQ
jgi:methyl-accepting chemotaxis protein